jgi:hypothetical protein
MKTSEEEQFERIRLAVDADTGAPDYWHSFTPQERIWALGHGYDSESPPSIQKVIEFLTLEQLCLRSLSTSPVKREWKIAGD